MQNLTQVQEEAGEAVAEGFNAGEVIIEHVANTGLDHPLIHLPTIVGIDFSVTKHVFMLWVVAALVCAGRWRSGADQLALLGDAPLKKLRVVVLMIKQAVVGDLDDPVT